MTKKAKDIFLKWAKGRSERDQRVLAIAIKNSKDMGEDINKGIAKEIIRATEKVINCLKV